MRNKSFGKTAVFIFTALAIASNLFLNSSHGDQATPYKKGYIEGFVKNKTANTIQIEEYDGTLHTLSLDSNVRFVIDTIPSSFSEFKYGMEIYAALKGKSISYMEAYSTENPGYIREDSKVRTGIIKKIDRSQIVVRTTLGTEEIYFISPATVITKQGINTPSSALYEGDTVKLFFSELNSTTISRMQIEGNSVLVKDLYRGVLSAADPIQNKITLQQVEVFRNGSWKSLKSSLSLPYSDKIPLYTGGSKLPFGHLKYYKGKMLYMAIKDFFGKEQIEKMVIKNQYETAYSEKIEEINWYGENFELSNNKNLSFNEGTIIIKNGRLVDKYGLNGKSDAFIVGDGRGSSFMANVVYVYNEDINNSNIGQDYLYEGRLDEITKDHVVLKDFNILHKNEWESFDEKKELFYNNDTRIYDLDAKKAVTVEEFYSNDYAVDEDSDYTKINNLRDWYGYIYTDGDQITNVVVKKKRDSILGQRITNGVVEQVPHEDASVGWRMKLREAKDWSERKEAWVAKSTSLNLLLGNAMLIKEGKMILPEELKAGDRLYMVRLDNQAVVILVK